MTTQVLAIDLRYRRIDSDQNWVTARYPANAKVIELHGLVRGVDYEGDARSVGPNNTFSEWVPVTFTVATTDREGNAALPPGGPANVASAWISGGAITYTAAAGTPATATISVALGTVRIAGLDVNYNAGSVEVTGTNGDTDTFHLYYKDYQLYGGTQTLYASRNYSDLVDSNANVYAGMIAVVFPSSGSGGGGGLPPCPLREAWCIRRTAEHREFMRAGEMVGRFPAARDYLWLTNREFVRAGEVVVGDYLLLTSGAWGLVTYSEPRLTSCVRVVGMSGKSISCSTAAPLGRTDGGQILSIDSLGVSIHIRCPVPVMGDTVAAVEPLGERWVQHITCEDDFFWVGDEQDCLFSHHNMKNAT